tara:strand:+ start:883 stop:1263 length:381 start_codon:yes stop_codon:yes gene_type:complete
MYNIIRIIIISTLITCHKNQNTNISKEQINNKEYQINLSNGKIIYKNFCMSCHHRGVVGAPKLNETLRWEKIFNKGMDSIFANTLNGFNGLYGSMPPKGACVNCTNHDLFDALYFIIDSLAIESNQ